MNTLFIQNGPIESQAPDAGFIEQQMEWLTNVIDTRLKLYFGHESQHARIEDRKSDDHSWYSQLFCHDQLSFADKLLLWLSLAPSLKPQLLDCFSVKNQDIDNRFSEFGAYRAVQLNGLLPTLDSLLFILFGDDIQK